jgi:hypothetical protein
MKTMFKGYRMLSVMITLALILLPLSMSGQGSKTNFSGSWIYNAEKSTQPQGQGQRPGGPGRGGDFTAKQEANLLTVERTMETPNGESTTMTSKYTLDGKESVNSTGRGESKSVATWSADGKKLTIKTTRTFNRQGQDMTMTSTEVWSLTDPKTLTIEMTMPGPNGERKMTSVYNKK